MKERIFFCIGFILFGMIPSIAFSQTIIAPVEPCPTMTQPVATCALADEGLDTVHIKITWTDCSQEVNYKIYRTQEEERLNDDAVWALIDTVGASTTVYDDVSVQLATLFFGTNSKYYYKVVAISSDDTIATSNICNATMPTLAATTTSSSSSGGGGGGCFIDVPRPGGGSGLSILFLMGILLLFVWYIRGAVQKWAPYLNKI